MTLTQFLDQNIKQTLRWCENKSKHVHRGFKFSNQPLWVGPALSGWLFLIICDMRQNNPVIKIFIFLFF